MCTVTGGTNYHNSPDAQCICFEQHGWGKLSSLEVSRGEQPQAVKFQKRKLQLLVFAHSQARGFPFPSLTKWEVFVLEMAVPTRKFLCILKYVNECVSLVLFSLFCFFLFTCFLFRFVLFCVF